MVNINEAIIARYKHAESEFEILVDCDKALEYRAGEIDSLDDVLATKDIFKDVKKSEKASETELLKVFKTEDPLEIASIIIKKGEIQLTTEHKAKLREEKRKKIVNFIHKNAIDSKTGHPHPLQRIEMVMEQAKIRVDEFKSVTAQVQDVMAKIRPLIPIKFEQRELSIQVPSEFTGKCYNCLRNFGKVIKEDWLSSGTLSVILDIPSGVQEDLENELNKLTRGEVQIKVLNRR